MEQLHFRYAIKNDKMAKRIYFQTIIYALIIALSGSGVYYGPDVMLYFTHAENNGAINITDYSGDSHCNATSWDAHPDEICYAYINFTANEDAAFYPRGYDPWGRDYNFSFEPGVKDYKLQRSWGSGWRTIPLNDTCKGTWCGGKRGAIRNVYSIMFREGKDYNVRIAAIKNNASDDVKWGFGSADPVWFGDKKDKSKDIKPQISNVANITYDKNFRTEIIKHDELIHPEIEYLGNNTFEIVYYQKKGIPTDFKWGSYACAKENGLNKDNKTLSKKQAPHDWCEKNEGAGYELLSNNSRVFPYSQTFTIDDNITDFEIFGGNGSFTIVVNSTSEGLGSGLYSVNKRIFYDNNNNRWHIIYVDSGSDIHSISSSDKVTWDDGIDIDTTYSYNYENFDCEIDYDGSTTYLHCVFGSGTTYFFRYKRCELTNSGSYISCGGSTIPWRADQGGGSTADDVSLFRITLDSNDCVISLFEYENDSLTTLEEHQITLLKEDSSACGDGSFTNSDIETGYPIIGIQSAPGYNLLVGMGLKRFSNFDDIQLYWNNQSFMSMYFNSTGNSLGTEFAFNYDVEVTGISTSIDMLPTPSNNISGFFKKDGLDNTLYSGLVSSLGGTSVSEKDTGIDVGEGSGSTGLVTATYDSNESNSYVFAVDSTDLQDIYYAISEDNGGTWINDTLWIDEAGTNEVKFLDSYFNEETCEIMVVWLGGSSSPFSTSIATYETTCFAQPSGNTCDCSSIQAGTTVDCTENCSVDSTCDASGQNILLSGSGSISVTANITNHGNVTLQNNCNVTCIGGCFKTN
jgi:hypothetical protein